MAHIPLQGTRPSAIAGAWYPGSAPALRKTVQDFLSNVPGAPLGRPLGLIAPHAGYMYSGQVAAHAYAQIVGQSYDTVILFSPIHRGYLALGGAVLAGVTAYSTPLGAVALNQEMVDRLDDRVRLSVIKRDDEHSLEIQLPFLQETLGAFDIVPIMMADQSLEFCQELGRAAATTARESGRRVLFVASTDLSHFYTYDQARKLDQSGLDYVNAYDLVGLGRALQSGKTEACGGGQVMAALAAGKELGATNARILHYANSGDVTGDKSRVVGYAAGVIL